MYIRIPWKKNGSTECNPKHWLANVLELCLQQLMLSISQAMNILHEPWCNSRYRLFDTLPYKPGHRWFVIIRFVCMYSFVITRVTQNAENERLSALNMQTFQLSQIFDIEWIHPKIITLSYKKKFTSCSSYVCLCVPIFFFFVTPLFCGLAVVDRISSSSLLVASFL